MVRMHFQLLALPLAACASRPIQGNPTPGETKAIPAKTVPSSPPTDATSNSEVISVSLVGDETERVDAYGLSTTIAGSWHKTWEPVVGVDVLFTTDDGRYAQVGWRVESGDVGSSWRAIEGRRYLPETREYVDESLPEWEVRLESIDAANAGGSPTAITISIRPQRAVSE